MNQFTLSWEEEISSSQFDELRALSRQYREAQRVAREAEQQYHQRAQTIAQPLIHAKMVALGAKLNAWDKTLVQLFNEGMANPKPLLAITVSNVPDRSVMAIAD